MKEGRTMKKLMMRLIVLVLAVAMLLPGHSLALDNTNYATHGDGKTNSTFFVESFGNARVIFTQQVGKCYKSNQGIQDEWGRFHFNITTPSGSTYTEDWNMLYGGFMHQLELRDAGIYMIEVKPYSLNEMQTALQHPFYGWSPAPVWWLMGWANCTVETKLETDICVIKREISSNRLLGVENQTVAYGENKVEAGAAPEGYYLVYPTAATTVNVYKNGMTSQNEVAYYYSKGLPPTPVPTTIPTVPPTPTVVNPFTKKVTPTSWDTRFKPETCTTSNKNRINNLKVLYDGNISTVFGYTLWNSEWQDGKPQFTANFDKSTIWAIGLVNGYATSESMYQYNASVRYLNVKVKTDNGDYEFSYTVPDMFTQQIQPFSFGGPIQNVNSIEIYVTGMYPGDSDKYFICMSDLCFYEY